MGRRLARPGLSYLDANKNRLITIERDVLDIKARIQENWPELDVFFDEVDEQWVVVEHCGDGVDRLVLTTDTLDERVLDRLHKADGHRADARDPLDVIDAENEKLERELERKHDDQLGDAGERLLHALRKDGVDAGISKIFVPNERRVRQDST